MVKLCLVAGARPNFMKIAPIIDAIKNKNRLANNQISNIFVHTGQHYDQQMSKLFFDDLGIPAPDINLEVGSASHAVQTAEIMKRFEKVCLKEKPTHVLVVGDVNSTIACGLVASKLEIKIIHVEAGLRSFDRNMPEEINRLLTDTISDFLFTTEESAHENLRREGIPEEKIHFVGNVMIDTLLKHRKKAEQSDILYRLGLIEHQPNNSVDPINPSNSTNPINPFAVLTLHRPSNVDDKETFQDIIEALIEISNKIPILFPVHPRTLNRIKEFSFENYFNWACYNSITSTSQNNSMNTRNSSNPKNPTNAINLISPLGYFDFLHLMANAKLVLTDSGGIQEETTILGIPCVTLRENTERPVTVTQGTNVVSGVKKENITKAAFSQLPKFNKPQIHNKPNSLNKPSIPPLWDGKAAERIVDILVNETW